MSALMIPLARVIPTLLVLSLVAGCASLTKPWIAPEVALAGLRIQELGLLRQVFVVSLTVRNPNDRALPVRALTYRIELEGQELAEGTSSVDRQIPAFGEALVDVDVVGNLLGVAVQLPILAQKDRPLDWTVSGTVTIAGGFLTLPFRYSGQLDPRTLSTIGGRATRSYPGVGMPTVPPQ